ncbi:MAG: hypothetical protein RXN92_04015 [Thermoplasmatales archaeon]
MSTAPVTSTTSSTGPYSLTLVISPNNWFNNATIHHRQPAYFVVGPNGQLESSAKIMLPAH